MSHLVCLSSPSPSPPTQPIQKFSVGGKRETHPDSLRGREGGIGGDRERERHTHTVTVRKGGGKKKKGLSVSFPPGLPSPSLPPPPEKAGMTKKFFFLLLLLLSRKNRSFLFVRLCTARFQRQLLRLFALQLGALYTLPPTGCPGKNVLYTVYYRLLASSHIIYLKFCTGDATRDVPHTSFFSGRPVRYGQHFISRSGGFGWRCEISAQVRLCRTTLFYHGGRL